MVYCSSVTARKSVSLTQGNWLANMPRGILKHYVYVPSQRFTSFEFYYVIYVSVVLWHSLKSVTQWRVENAYFFFNMKTVHFATCGACTV